MVSRKVQRFPSKLEINSAELEAEFPCTREIMKSIKKVIYKESMIILSQIVYKIRSGFSEMTLQEKKSVINWYTIVLTRKLTIKI